MSHTSSNSPRSKSAASRRTGYEVRGDRSHVDISREQPHSPAYATRRSGSAKAKLQERERLQRQHAVSASSVQNPLGKRPLSVVPADSTSPTAPGRRHEPSLARTAAVSNASTALQGALAPGSGATAAAAQKHFAGADGKGGGPDTAPLKSMIGQYVEYDLSTLKNSRGGFLLESEEDDPKRLRERQMQEELRLKRLENARVQGQLRGAGQSRGLQYLPAVRSRNRRPLVAR